MSGRGLAASGDASAVGCGAAYAAEGWLSEIAADCGAMRALDGLQDSRNEVELAVYRAHHAQTVVSASPLALDLLSHLRFDVDALMTGLRPRRDWRRWVCGVRPSGARHGVRWGEGASPVAEEDERDLFLHGCLVVREWSDPVGAIGVRLSPAALEIGARVGPAHLRTIGGVATITTAMPIPGTIKVASLGRPVEQVFDHPVLRDRGYVVADQYDRVPTADDPREAWRIEFRAEPVRWQVPWARTRTDGGDHHRGHHVGADAPTLRTSE